MERLGDILARYTTPTVTSKASSDTSSDASANRCSLCQGAGWVNYDLPLDHPDRGKAFPCECTRQKWEEQRRRRLLDQSGLGALHRLNFDTFSAREGEIPEDASKDLGAILCDVQEYAEQRWPQGWLLLAGNYGCGKTHLAAAAVSARVSRGWPAQFVVVPDLLDHLRSAFGPNAEIDFDAYFERLKHAEFLVLDDLGAEYGTAWATEKLFQLVNHRYNAQLPTVFTTNAQTEDIEPRIRSRLLDKQLTKTCAITAPDYRLTQPGSYRGNADPSEAAVTAATTRPSRRRR
ncbi:MAG: ATP-binding protein [Chloroflexi bacterium]|nr:ATP-binding protein [Chloroflexota bacterium]